MESRHRGDSSSGLSPSRATGQGKDRSSGVVPQRRGSYARAGMFRLGDGGRANGAVARPTPTIASFRYKTPASPHIAVLGVQFRGSFPHL
jgi:hypothetical protein